MNPFNQRRFRSEHEIGEAYLAVRKVYENLEAIQMVADHLEQFRSGNIELKSEELELLWKYTAEDDWKVLGDLSPYISQYIQSVSNINARMDDVDNTVTSLSNSVQDLTGDVEDFDNRLDTFNNTLTGIATDLSNLTIALGNLSQELDILTNTVNANTQSISDLELRVEALENIVEPEDPEP